MSQLLLAVCMYIKPSTQEFRFEKMLISKQYDLADDVLHVSYAAI